MRGHLPRLAIWMGLALLFGTLGCARGTERGPEVPPPVAADPTSAAVDHPDHGEHGEVSFEVSCADEARAHLEHGLAHLHHMMYEQAQASFEAAVAAEPRCAMAHWGVAMTSFQPLWHPTSDEGLVRGKAAVAEARALGAPTAREQGYITAAAAFFADPEPPAPDRPSDHRARVLAWEEAQRRLHEAYPEDVDAAAFYALAQVAAAPPDDRTYARQRRAGALLERYFADHPRHPGLFHYLIHAYDSPTLAPKAEEIARAYDDLAPEVPHALHMPSHIFVRLGHWEETAEWNERSARAALLHPVENRTSLHYVHALDYMMYAYLQRGEEAKARATLERVEAVETVQPVFASAYGIAAARARYPLERSRWEEAAELAPRTPDALPWDDFPAADALIHYARGLGAARAGRLEQAAAEEERVAALVGELEAQGDEYWATMTEALRLTVAAWRAHGGGDRARGLSLMRAAAEREDALDKHPITPGEIRPARELYGEMLLLEDRPQEALVAFEAALERTPNRRNAVAGREEAARAARRPSPPLATPEGR